jgi:hypothetical protein
MMESFDRENKEIIGSENTIIIRDLKTITGIQKRYKQWILRQLSKGYKIILKHLPSNEFSYNPDKWVTIKEIKNASDCGFYNGWYNRDTWAFNLNLVNDQYSYNYLKDNKHRLLKLKRQDLINELRSECTILDSVNYNKVNISEIKDMINEL